MNKKSSTRSAGVSPVLPKDRLRILESSRHRKMARSAHAYVRGNTLKFYEWLEAGAGAKLPQGPPVWICGDCHVGNLGPVADSDGQVEIEIRDLDQTVVGNPAHDLIRLGLSLATAARGSDLPGVTTARMMEQMIVGYEKALASPRKEPELAEGGVRPIDAVMQQALRRRWRHLAEERIEDVTPTIPLGRRFWALAPEERDAIEELFKTDAARAMITNLNNNEKDAKIRVLDAAYWMKGCSSLGRLRFAVLLGVGPKRHQRLSLIDIKEAVKAAAPASKEADKKQDFAERVVAGACALSPYLGERMMAATLLRRPVVVRELMPQDLKLEIERLSRDEAVAVAEYLAGVVGKAHARQMDAKTRKAWREELKRHRPKDLEAPGWLWSSVVELVASHEAAYLEHCRRYAAVRG
jgi:uncharacterized protein (DUF2252 family)